MKPERVLSEFPIFVESDPVEIPEMTGDPIVDVQNQLAFEPGEFESIFVDPEKRATRAELLLGIADNLGAGLDPPGKRKWIESRLVSGATLLEILQESKELKES